MGMEYPGIVTARSIRNTGPVNLEDLKYMIDHEIAHQWFYGVVSNDPYNDAWLDEGFANFSEAVYVYSSNKLSPPYPYYPDRLKDTKQYPINYQDPDESLVK